jgi:hypothetical protein
VRIPTVKKVQSRMRLLAATIRSLTKRQLRKGKPVSYGVFDATLPPNTTEGRTPNPFSGGN